MASAKVIQYTIPAGAAVLADFPILRLGAKSIVAIKWPDVMTNTTVKFYANYSTGVFQVLHPGAGDFSEVAVPGEIWTLSGGEVRNFRVLQQLIITTQGVEAADRVFEIITRHVG